MDFEPYADSIKKQGYDQVVERVWKPLTTVAEHTRIPSDAKAIVAQGRPDRSSADSSAVKLTRRRRA